MSDMSMEPMGDEEFDGLMDPVEKAQLDLLQQMVQLQQVMAQQVSLLAQLMAEVARISALPRRITGTRSDGKPMEAISSVNPAGAKYV